MAEKHHQIENRKTYSMENQFLRIAALENSWQMFFSDDSELFYILNFWFWLKAPGAHCDCNVIVYYHVLNGRHFQAYFSYYFPTHAQPTRTRFDDPLPLSAWACAL